MPFNRFILVLTSLFLISCSSIKTPNNIPNNSKVHKQKSIAERNQQLSAINEFTVKGKIAFLQDKKRESASLIWSHNKMKQQQQLDLTAVFINVLHLKSDGENHIIEVDNREYKTKNLNELIYQLTGLTLPTEALSYWIKGLSYQQQDKITYHQTTNLPASLSSSYNNQRWQVTYSEYQPFNKQLLPTKLNIRQNGLTIKIMINHWTIS